MQPKPLDVDNSSKDISVKTARMLSNIFSPPVINTILGLLVALTVLPLLQGLFWGFTYGLLISMLTMVAVIYMLKTGRATDLHLTESAQRHFPYLVSIIGSVAIILLINRFNGPALLGSLAVGTMITLIILLIVNIFWLISSHMASVTLAALFVAAAFGPVYGVIMIPLVVLVFIIRYYLRRHTVYQLVAGMMVGVLSIVFLQTMGLL